MNSRLAQRGRRFLPPLQQKSDRGGTNNRVAYPFLVADPYDYLMSLSATQPLAW